MSRRIFTSCAALLVIFLLLALAFSFIDLHFAQSTTETQKAINTASSGEDLPSAMTGSNDLALTVTGASRLADRLEQRLADRLRESGRFSSVEVIPETIDTGGIPYLLVRVDNIDLFWTPVYATAEVTASFGFGSNGDIRHMEAGSATFSNENSPGIASWGEFVLGDSSWGLVTLPGYYTVLANQYASQIVETIIDLYER